MVYSDGFAAAARAGGSDADGADADTSRRAVSPGALGTKRSRTYVHVGRTTRPSCAAYAKAARQSTAATP